MRGWQRTQAKGLLEYSFLATAKVQEGKPYCARRFKPLFVPHLLTLAKVNYMAKLKVKKWKGELESGFIRLIWDQ